MEGAGFVEAACALESLQAFGELIGNLTVEGHNANGTLSLFAGFDQDCGFAAACAGLHKKAGSVRGVNAGEDFRLERVKVGHKRFLGWVD